MYNNLEQDIYLLAFLKAYLAWANGEPGYEDMPFRSYYGLCGNWDNFLESEQTLKMFNLDFYPGLYWEHCDALIYFFGYFHLDMAYPFGADDYGVRSLNHNMQECPSRLQFCRDTIAVIEQYIKENSND